LRGGEYDATVEGYASSEGQLEHNKKLSLRRAQSVVNYLVAKGVDRANLTPVGMGIIDPVADNATEEGRVKNRRVEFITIRITKKGQ
jgi:OOP family OmpA-OmpF porin